jgi:hypothetical protein
VNRAGYDAIIRSRDGTSARLLLVYLQRGRVLIGIYGQLSGTETGLVPSPSDILNITTAITARMVSGQVE